MPSSPRRAFVVHEKGTDFTARASAATNEGGVIHLRGDVDIVAGSVRITADEADLRDGEAILRGHVKVRVRQRRWWSLFRTRH